MVIDKKKLEEIVRTNPLALLILKKKEEIQYVHSLLPYSIGFEVECAWQGDHYTQAVFDCIPNIMAVDCSAGEKRFRIPNGISGFLCLYEICKLLKTECYLNPGSGIHYHVDCTDIQNDLMSYVSKHNNAVWILEELDMWDYKGQYNKREYGGWYRTNFSGQTLEFRVGEMSFDYTLLIKRILHATAIVKRIKNEIAGIKPTEKTEDAKQVINNRVIKL